MGIIGKGSQRDRAQLSRRVRARDSPADDFQFYLIDGSIVSDNVEIDALQTIDKPLTRASHTPTIIR